MKTSDLKIKPRTSCTVITLTTTKPTRHSKVKQNANGNTKLFSNPVTERKRLKHTDHRNGDKIAIVDAHRILAITINVTW